MRRTAALLVLVATLFGMAAAGAAAATLSAPGGIYAFNRYEGSAFAPATLRITLKTDAGTARFRIDGLPAFIRADRTTGTATTSGAVVTLTADPNLPRTLGTDYTRFSIVNLDAPSSPPFSRVVAIRTFASASRGEALFNARCEGCHQSDGQGVAPLLRGVFGRHAGSLIGFPYSKPMRAFDKVWTYPLLFRWLTDTEALVPGTKMSNSPVIVLSDRQRHDLIAYLASISRR